MADESGTPANQLAGKVLQKAADGSLQTISGAAAFQGVLQQAATGEIQDLSGLPVNIAQLGNDGESLDGQGSPVHEVIDVSGGPEGQPQIIRDVIMTADNRVTEYVVQDMNFLRNSTTNIEIKPLERATYHMSGDIVAGTHDSTRVVGADFSLNAWSQGSSVFGIGDAFQGFFNQQTTPSSGYENIFDSIGLATVNGNLTIQITNGNGSIDATNATVFFRLVQGQEP